MKIRLLSISALLCLVSACTSVTPSVQFYQLSEAPQMQGVNLLLPKLQIEPVELVDYLKRSNLLLQQKTGQLYITKYHVWAESLDQAIARTMVNFLNRSQKKFRAQSQFEQQCQQACYRLKLLVERFYPTENSSVIFAGKYQLLQDNALIAQHDFNLQQALEGDGYGVAVASLRSLTVKLASQIQEQLSQKL